MDLSIDGRAGVGALVFLWLLALGALFSFVSVSRATGPSVVQATYNTRFYGDNWYVSTSFSSPVTTGDTIIAECTSMAGYASITSITDAFGTLAIQASTSFFGGTNYFTIASITATSSLSDTITCHTSGAIQPYLTLSIQEVSGIVATASATASGSGTGTAMHTTSSPSYPYDSFLVASYGRLNGSTFTAGSGFTLTIPGTGTYAADSEYYLDTSGGSSNFPMTISSSEEWGGVGAVFQMAPVVTTTQSTTQTSVSTHTTTSGTTTMTSLSTNTVTTVVTSTSSLTPVLGNLYLKDAQSDGTIDFDIQSYPNSYVKVSFPNGPPVYYYNITTPSVQINTHGANLVTVWVSNDYFDTIIPKDTSLGFSNTVYLSKPNRPVDFYVFSVQDLTGYYPASTRIYLNDTTGTYANRMLASGYVDASNYFDAWAVPGSYSIELVNGHHSFTEQVNLPSITDSTVLVQILKVTNYGNCGQVCTVGYSAGFNSALDHVWVVFNDSTDTADTVTTRLFMRNISVGSPFLLGSNTGTGHYGNYQYGFLCDTDLCNSTIGGQLEVQLYFHDTFGPTTVTLPVGGGAIFPLPNFPDAALGGWGDIFPASLTFVSMIAMALIYASAGVFGALSSKFGVIPVAILTLAFTLSGWLPGLLVGAAVLLTSLGVVSFMGYLRHGR